MPRSWTPAGRPRPCPLRPFGVLGSGHWTPSPPALCVSRLIRFREVRSLPCGLQDSLCTLRLCRSVLRASFIIATLGIGRVANPCQRSHYRSASLSGCADSDSRDSHPQKRAASPGAPNVAKTSFPIDASCAETSDFTVPSPHPHIPGSNVIGETPKRPSPTGRGDGVRGSRFSSSAQFFISRSVLLSRQGKSTA